MSTRADREAAWQSIRAYGRLLPALPRMLPSGAWSGSRLLEDLARSRPDDVGIAYEDRRLSWGDIDARVNQIARCLGACGVGHGDAVALLMDNRPEYLLVLTAVNRLRGIAALINTNVNGAGLAHAFNVAKPRLLIVGAEHLDKVDEVLPELSGIERAQVLVQCESGSVPARWTCIDAAADAEAAAPPADRTAPKTSEPMCYIYTSGTTGLPKAAIITNQRWLVASNLFGRMIYESSDRDVIYCPLPLYHSNGIFGGWGACLNTGATLALRRKFSASRFWDDVQTFGATAFIYIGELCRYLLNQPEKPAEENHHIRVATGNGLRPDIWGPFQARFGIPLIREFYGATEGNTPIVNYTGRPGMIGRLGPGQVLVRCDVASGELQRNAEGRCETIAPGETGLLLGRINAITKFDGYVDRGASQKKIIENAFKDGDRYFNTGDLIDLHAGGWASFADRVGDTFRWKGENVSTNEVAEALNLAPGVLESNVYGVRVWGTDGRAGMASLVCDDSFSLEAFTALVTGRLPAYQRPYFIRIQKDMRVTGTFKHQKVDYREEGFDPERVSDPLYFLEGDRYVPLDPALYRRIKSGEAALR